MNRYAARELVTFNAELSAGAARLYLALDEYARDSGVCWPRQRTLRSRMGCSARSLQYYLAELVTAELCMVERSTPGGPNRYRLFHSFHSAVRNQTQSVALPGAIGCTTLAQPGAPLIRNNPGSETERAANAERQPPPVTLNVCPSCRGKRRILIPAVGWSDCTPCRGTGRQAERKAS